MESGGKNISLNASPAANKLPSVQSSCKIFCLPAHKSLAGEKCATCDGLIQPHTGRPEACTQQLKYSKLPFSCTALLSRLIIPAPGLQRGHEWAHSQTSGRERKSNSYKGCYCPAYLKGGASAMLCRIPAQLRQCEHVPGSGLAHRQCKKSIH